MGSNERTWVLLEFRWLFVLAAVAAVAMIGVGATQEGVVSAMTFSGAYLLFAVVVSALWSWFVHRERVPAEIRTPLVGIGGVGIVGFAVIAVVTRDWTAVLNSALLAGVVGLVWWELRDSSMWTAE